jgi:ubiquinone/menaquinone biosynthesis C-methylase UbiE
MSFYSKYMLPTLTHFAMRSRTLRPERARWVPLAKGVVLEVGVGSGLNLPMYGREVRKLYALDPSEELLRMARLRAARAAFAVEFLCRPAEAIPLACGSVDDVVTTWTLCTIPDPVAALQEMHRVLRPEGRLIFVEHGRSPDAAVVRWQDRLTPLWRKVTGGCHLNRPIDRLLRLGGFEVLEMDQGYLPGPRVGAYLYRGIARPATDGRVRGTDIRTEKGVAHGP